MEKKKWITVNGAHVPIEDSKPKFGGDNKAERTEQARHLKNLLTKKPEANDGFREQSNRSNFFEDDSEDLETVEVDLTADIQKQFDNAKTPKERSKIAYRYIMDNLRGKYPAKDGREVSIESLGIKKITHTLYEPKLRATPELGKLLKSGQFIGEKSAEKESGEKHKHFDRFAYYRVFVKIGNDTYKAILNIGIRRDSSCTLYDINQFDKK